MAKLPRLESRDVLLTFARISKVCKMPNEGERARYDVVKTQCGICWLAYQRFVSVRSSSWPRSAGPRHWGPLSANESQPTEFSLPAVGGFRGCMSPPLLF